ncbi:unnamed protein product, partial [Mesorhabditis spiculigera]
MAAGGLEELDYYHGLLPREDLPVLLSKEGDYLLRCSQVKAGEDRRTILSMAYSVDGKIKQGHYIITQEREPPNHYTIDKTLSKPTVDLLVQEYKTRRVPLKKEVPSTVLQNAVTRPSWELRADFVHTGKKLGDGEFGDVHQGKLKQLMGPGLPSKEIDVAIKVARKDIISKEKIKEVMKEARLMRDFDHPNVVKIYGVVVERDPLMIVMELVDGGGLDKYLRTNAARITPAERLCIIQDAAWGIEYLHHKRIIHRDLAARNCLIVNDHGRNLVKISDFGLSREGDAYAMKTVRKVPIRWLAPETIQTFIYTAKSDVWAYGILAWEVYTSGEEPYAGLPNAHIKQKIVAGELLELPASAGAEVIKLIKVQCWEKDPVRRISMSQVACKLEAMNGRTPPPVQESSVRKGVHAAPAEPPRKLPTARPPNRGPGKSRADR